MNLAGFDIENWACLKRVTVTDLPETGIIVLHGPNGTGKSSIVEALRACLMDNKSTSKALGRGFPKNSNEKPRVSVTFRAGGSTYKITKLFGSKESKLESLTPAGQWKLETADPSEAHERTRQLTGNCDSAFGLHQLLWLTQAEFNLPDPKKFDADVQSRLRNVLGVLQTPLDDRFLGKVKEEWGKWFGARGKPGEKPKLRKDGPLDKAQTELEQFKAELSELEEKYQGFEKMLDRSRDLEVVARDLKVQRENKRGACDLLQKEYENSLKRIEAHRRAGDRLAATAKAVQDAHAQGQRRSETEQRWRSAENSVAALALEIVEFERRLQEAEEKRQALRLENQELVNQGREWQARFNALNERRQALTLREQLKRARENLLRADQTTCELESLKEQARARPAPEEATVKMLEANRQRASQARAELEAAAIGLTLLPLPGTPALRLALDGGPAEDIGTSTEGAPICRSLRRRAEIVIPGWGSAEITRGLDARSLDQIENELRELDQAFGEGLAPFGLTPGDTTALDQLRGLAAEKKVRAPELKRKQEEVNRSAPKGMDPLREELARLEKVVLANSAFHDGHDLPADPDQLAELANLYTEKLGENARTLRLIEQRIESIEHEIDSVTSADQKNIRASRKDKPCPGLRNLLADAKEKSASFQALANLFRDELARMMTAAQIELEVRAAESAHSLAQSEFEALKLNVNEETIRERLDAALDGLKGIQARLGEAEKEFHQIEGALRLSEGLHQERAAAAARVDEVERRTERCRLESAAWDRLYALFEECREKQLGAVMGPIHDRVLSWMRLLRIGGYEAIRFNDQFLPDKLLAAGGSTEFTLTEESTGTIEQIALMVRLALGSALATPAEPVVAILDDPLTHSDVIRLDGMRAVLKKAAAGDPCSKPPAGPLQIIVLTCHPEWFSLDEARIIDLAALVN